MESLSYLRKISNSLLYGSEKLCLKENEKSVLRRTKRAMAKAMCTKSSRQKDCSRPNGHAGVKRSCRKVGKIEWIELHDTDTS